MHAHTHTHACTALPPFTHILASKMMVCDVMQWRVKLCKFYSVRSLQLTYFLYFIDKCFRDRVSMSVCLCVYGGGVYLFVKTCVFVCVCVCWGHCFYQSVGFLGGHLLLLLYSCVDALKGFRVSDGVYNIRYQHYQFENAIWGPKAARKQHFPWITPVLHISIWLGFR